MPARSSATPTSVKRRTNRRFIGGYTVGNRPRTLRLVGRDTSEFSKDEILNDWSDEESEQILRSIRRAAAPKAKLLIAEWLIPGDGKPSWTFFVDHRLRSLRREGVREPEFTCPWSASFYVAKTPKTLRGT